MVFCLEEIGYLCHLKQFSLHQQSLQHEGCQVHRYFRLFHPIHYQNRLVQHKHLAQTKYLNPPHQKECHNFHPKD